MNDLIKLSVSSMYIDTVTFIGGYVFAHTLY